MVNYFDKIDIEILGNRIKIENLELSIIFVAWEIFGFD